MPDDQDVQPTPAHLEALLDTMPSGRGDPACQSYFLWCLAAVLARLSSQAFFGTHNDGPFALRRYAAALGNAAIRLQDDQQSPWRAGYVMQLLSKYCTDELTKKQMYPDLAAAARRNDGFRSILATVWPPNWGHLL